jgi:hypothetical protein
MRQQSHDCVTSIPLLYRPKRVSSGRIRKRGEGRLRGIAKIVREIYPEDSTITGRIMVTIFLVLAVLSISAVFRFNL